jgi:7-cyano-7-deazaguanine synthase in queuosine biosynthesis
MKKNKALVLMSGGPDSFIAAYWSKIKFRKTLGLFVDVGHDAANKEREFFKEQVGYLDIDRHELNLSGFMPAFSQISPKSQSIFKGAGLPLLPFSSGIALSIGISTAIAQGADHLVLGLHKVDFETEEYNLPMIEAIAKASLCGNSPVSIQIPFRDMTKEDLFSYGIEQGLPMKASWSCVGGASSHCGQCKPCISRSEAFEKVHAPKMLLAVG